MSPIACYGQGGRGFDLVGFGAYLLGAAAPTILVAGLILIGIGAAIAGIARALER